MVFLFFLKAIPPDHYRNLLCSPYSREQRFCKAQALLHLKLASSHGYNS